MKRGQIWLAAHGVLEAEERQPCSLFAYAHFGESFCFIAPLLNSQL